MRKFTMVRYRRLYNMFYYRVALLLVFGFLFLRVWAFVYTSYLKIWQIWNIAQIINTIKAIYIILFAISNKWRRHTIYHNLISKNIIVSRRQDIIIHHMWTHCRFILFKQIIGIHIDIYCILRWMNNTGRQEQVNTVRPKNIFMNVKA